MSKRTSTDRLDNRITVGTPLILLDFDDVLAINRLYGGYDVLAPNPPADLFDKLFHPPAVETLLMLLSEFEPRVVITTSWLRLMDVAVIYDVLSKTGMQAVADALHPHCEARQEPGDSRLATIERWLAAHHGGEPFVVLDDTRSGSGLAGSHLAMDERVVLCEPNVGLHRGHLAAARAALVRKSNILGCSQVGSCEDDGRFALGTRRCGNGSLT